MQNTTGNTTFPTGSAASGPNGSEGSMTKTSTSAHSAVDRAASAADAAAKKIKPVIDRVASGAHQAVDKAVGVAVPTAKWLTERSQNLKQTQDKVISDARDYVTTNPLKAVGIALAAGLVIGRLMR